MFFELLFLCSSEIKNYIKCSFFFFSYFSELIVENHEIIFESIDRSEVDVHSVPSDKF